MTQLPLPFDFGEPGRGPTFLTIAEAAEQLQVCEAHGSPRAARGPRSRNEGRARLLAPRRPRSVALRGAIMSRVSTQAPRVEIRRRTRSDGSVSEVPTVRYTKALGERKRLTCSSLEEAELERVRLALDLSRGKLPEPDRVLTVAGF